MKVLWPAGSTRCSDQPSASNDVERAAPHDSESSLSAARSERSCLLDRMDGPNVKVARGELSVGVSAALGSPRRTSCRSPKRIKLKTLSKLLTSSLRDARELQQMPKMPRA